jgi:hypothetical protein
MTHEQAVDHLTSKVLVGGDDGAAADVPMETLTFAANKIGLKMTGGTVPHGYAGGVDFLGRVWPPAAFYGDPGSMSDTPRQLSKWHVTTRPTTDHNAVVAADKAVSLLFTDRGNPILGIIAKTILAAGLENPDVSVSSIEQLFASRIQYMPWLAAQFNDPWPQVSFETAGAMITHWELNELEPRLMAWTETPLPSFADSATVRWAGRRLHVDRVVLLLSKLPAFAIIEPDMAPVAECVVVDGPNTIKIDGPPVPRVVKVKGPPPFRKGAPSSRGRSRGANRRGRGGKKF